MSVRMIISAHISNYAFQLANAFCFPNDKLSRTDSHLYIAPPTKATSTWSTTWCGNATWMPIVQRRLFLGPSCVYVMYISCLGTVDSINFSVSHSLSHTLTLCVSTHRYVCPIMGHQARGHSNSGRSTTWPPRHFQVFRGKVQNRSESAIQGFDRNSMHGTSAHALRQTQFTFDECMVGWCVCVKGPT